MVHIDGAGGYVPLYRVERDVVAAQHGGSASGESAVPGRDENGITMAAEAAGNALARSDVDGPDLDAVFAASVSDPYAEHGVAAHVAYRHGAEGDVRTGDLRATARAATDAFAAGVHFVEATGGTALVVGTDVLPVEPRHDDEAYSGAAAGAVVLADGPADPLATVHGVGQQTTGFVERHRRHGEPAEHGGRRFAGEAGFGEAVPGAAEAALGEAPAMPSRVVVQVHDQRSARGAVEELPGEVELVSTFDAVGYAGAAGFYLDLAHLLETADEGTTGLAVSYGAGGADAVAFTTLGGVEEVGAPGTAEADPGDGATTVGEYLDSREYVTYADHLRYREQPDYRGVSVE